MIYVAAVCLLTLLGVAYVKLYDVVKAHQPEALPRFYLIMTVIRMILVASLAGIYILQTRRHPLCSHLYGDVCSDDGCYTLFETLKS